MAEVKLSVAGRYYALHCRDGEEARLHALARLIGERVDKVKRGSPGLTEVRQLLFAALLLADELSDAEAGANAADTARRDAADQAAAQALESLAERLEALGQGLAAEGGQP